jgi:hypothetical protein
MHNEAIEKLNKIQKILKKDLNENIYEINSTFAHICNFLIFDVSMYTLEPEQLDNFQKNIPAIINSLNSIENSRKGIYKAIAEKVELKPSQAVLREEKIKISQELDNLFKDKFPEKYNSISHYLFRFKDKKDGFSNLQVRPLGKENFFICFAEEYMSYGSKEKSITSFETVNYNIDDIAKRISIDEKTNRFRDSRFTKNDFEISLKGLELLTCETERKSFIDEKLKELQKTMNNVLENTYKIKYKKTETEKENDPQSANKMLNIETNSSSLEIELTTDFSVVLNLDTVDTKESYIHNHDDIEEEDYNGYFNHKKENYIELSSLQPLPNRYGREKKEIDIDSGQNTNELIAFINNVKSKGHINKTELPMFIADVLTQHLNKNKTDNKKEIDVNSVEFDFSSKSKNKR